jgi:hypothetical protein
MRFGHKSLIGISGLLWFAVGLFLLIKGLLLITHAAYAVSLQGWIGSLAATFGDRQKAALCLVSIGLIIGFIKGRFVLAKSAGRMVAKIRSHEQPVAWSKVYTWREALLIGLMMCLGMGLRASGLSPDIRGTVDVAIGSALIHGALFYFRSMRLARAI